ncbi:MAG: rhodanese-like domain-containing protein [Chitinophagaceae bacterium]
MFGFIKRLFGAGPSVDFNALLKRGALIVDVRTSSEYRSGHIKGSVHIPLDQIKAKLPELKKKNKPVITCCRSGNRSGMAKNMLQAAGIECYNGGAWNSLQTKIQ